MTDELRHFWIRNGFILAIELALLALSIAAAFIPMNNYNTAVNISIAVIMATIGFLFFMELLHSSVILRLAAATGFVWLIVLFVLTLCDYLTRYSTTGLSPS
jgi:cytochrome c oxidase subunit IV